MTQDYHKIAVIPGDLNGITVTNAALKLSEAVSTQLKKPIKHTPFDYGADYFIRQNIITLRDKDLAKLAKCDQIFLGAVGDETKFEPGILEQGIIIKIRQAFNQYVNLRPIILPEGVWCPLKNKTHEDINFEICRENCQGLYKNQGWLKYEGTNKEVACQNMEYTYKRIKELVDFAVKRAIKRKKGDRPTVHMVFKENVLTYVGAIWNRVFNEYRHREDIIVKKMYIDNFVMQMIKDPKQFDVVATTNMFGDVISDHGAELSGGIGSAPSGNINPEEDYPSMFEPVHGSIPDMWYEKNGHGVYVPETFLAEKVQMVRPEAAFLSYAMMLEKIGEEEAAKLIKEAAHANMRDPEYKTKNLDDLVEQACTFVKSAR